MRRGPLVLAAVCAVLVAAALALAFTGEDGPRREPVPEGGSRLGNRPKTPAQPGLLGALSDLIARADPEAADPPRRRPRGTPRSAGGLAGRLAPSRLAAQVLLAGFEGQDLTDPFFERLRERDFGGIALEERNHLYAEQVAALAGEARVIASQVEHLPPLVLAAGTGALPSAALPEPGQLIATGSPASGKEAAAAAGAALAAMGVHAVLGPLADVGVPGAANESSTYGDEAPRVTAWVRGIAAGYRDAGVATAPGHFPGQGTAGQDPLEGPAAVGLPLESLRKRDLAPFAAIARSTRAMLVSNAAFAAFDAVTPASMSRPIVTGLLRRELRFDGVAIADNVLGAAAASGLSAGEAAVTALAAGCDMVYVRDEAEQEAAYRAILGALRRGELSEARLREAVARVLELKRELGLFTGATQ